MTSRPPRRGPSRTSRSRRKRTDHASGKVLLAAAPSVRVPHRERIDAGLAVVVAEARLARLGLGDPAIRSSHEDARTDRRSDASVRRRAWLVRPQIAIETEERRSNVASIGLCSRASGLVTLLTLRDARRRIRRTASLTCAATNCWRAPERRRRTYRRRLTVCDGGRRKGRLIDARAGLADPIALAVDVLRAARRP
jgi:hypothetical protein